MNQKPNQNRVKNELKTETKGPKSFCQNEPKIGWKLYQKWTKTWRKEPKFVLKWTKNWTEMGSKINKKPKQRYQKIFGQNEPKIGLKLDQK